jgi:hypothetical protein
MVMKKSYKEYLRTSGRSNSKLKVLHGEIAADLASKLGNDYKVKSLGYGNGKEGVLEGRYNKKAVDISVYKDGKELGGIALKFIMTNYSQNSNNYFENMLGETANIRCAGKAYYHIVILPEKLPYFKSDGDISKIETITPNNIEKYIKLSQDNFRLYMHTPEKMLLCLIKTPTIDKNTISNREIFKQVYMHGNNDNITYSDQMFIFGSTMIYNDYEDFIKKVAHSILSI